MSDPFRENNVHKPIVDAAGARPFPSPAAGGADGISRQVQSSNASEEATNSDDRKAKRRRIAKACEGCRRKKIKCDGQTPKCAYCNARSFECTYSHESTPRLPTKADRYVEALEHKVAHMENMLRGAGLLPMSDNQDLTECQPQSDLQRSRSRMHSIEGMHDTTGKRTTGHSSDTMYETSRPDDYKHTDSPKADMGATVANNMGQSRYFGSSSNFTIFSPRGTQWVKEKSGDDSFSRIFEDLGSKDFTWYHWKPEIFGDLFRRKTYQPLPPKRDMHALMKIYFEQCNSLLPLFHEPTFMHLVDKHYSAEPYEGSGWWACLNVAIAIAYRIRGTANGESGADTQLAWLYMKNALTVLLELTMRNNDLLSVQALAGLALFMQGTANPHMAFYLIGAATRLAHSIGLHKVDDNLRLNHVESEQRKRVFWIVYIVDKDISLRGGRPPAQDDDEISIGMPSEMPHDKVGTLLIGQGEDQKRLNLFLQMCHFARIQSRVYKLLYTERASRQSDSALLQTISLLDEELEEWKMSLPVEVRPEHEIRIAPTYVYSVTVLHFAYFNCLTTIHRMSVHHGYWHTRPSDRSSSSFNEGALHPRVFMSAAFCVNAARKSITLIRTLPPPTNSGCTWTILYYPITALVTLFANVLQNPLDQRGMSDVQLMQDVVDWLATLSDDESGGYVDNMKRLCSQFERISRVAIAKAQAESVARNDTAKAAPRNNINEEDLHGKGTGQKKLPGMSAADLAGTPLGMASEAAAAAAAQALKQSTQQNLNQSHAVSFDQGANVLNSSWSNGGHDAQSACTPANFAMMPPSIQTNNTGVLPYPDSTIPMTNYDDRGSGIQQPFVPQDLWQMPQTLEWDWAEAGSWAMGMHLGFDAGGHQ